MFAGVSEILLSADCPQVGVTGGAHSVGCALHINLWVESKLSQPGPTQSMGLLHHTSITPHVTHLPHSTPIAVQLDNVQARLCEGLLLLVIHEPTSRQHIAAACCVLACAPGMCETQNSNVAGVRQPALWLHIRAFWRLCASQTYAGVSHTHRQCSGQLPRNHPHACLRHSNQPRPFSKSAYVRNKSWWVTRVIL